MITIDLFGDDEEIDTAPKKDESADELKKREALYDIARRAPVLQIVQVVISSTTNAIEMLTT